MRVLIVAFDGLDYELIQEFECSEIISMNEFGQIDNHTDIDNIATAELFTTFISGTTEHNITGVGQDEDSISNKLLNMIPKQIRYFLKGYQGIVNLWNRITKNGVKQLYSQDDLEVDTWFDQIPNSKAVNVPAYSKNTYMSRAFNAYRQGWGDEPAIRDARAEHSHRKEELFEAMSEDYDLVMGHFHIIDILQHIHIGKEGKEKLRGEYENIDNLTREIKERAEEEGFDRVIFMSDHGLPAQRKHNKQAFYSSTDEMFGDRVPHISDFYDKVLDSVDSELNDMGFLTE